MFIHLFILLVALTRANQYSNGWGDDIEWAAGLDEAIAESEKTEKPLMLVIHKSWCGACKSLKPKFAESKKITELSDRFVMVNLSDDKEPEGDQYKPDGGYIPRILFMTGSSVHEEIYNKKGNPKYKYYYTGADSIVATMEEVLAAPKVEL